MITKKELQIINELKKTNPEAYKLINAYIENTNNNISIASHDIRNFISAISGQIQLINTKFPDIKNCENWISIMDSLNLTMDYINSTSELRYSNTCTFKTIDLLDILWNIPDYIDDLLEVTNLSYERYYDISLPDNLPLIQGDFERLKYAFLAIVRNSIEATKEQDTIHIKADVDSTSQLIVISITDCGTGISNEIKDNLFIPFKTSKPSHAGVGLATAKNTIEKHKGTIEISSVNNKTTVTICLPY